MIDTGSIPVSEVRWRGSVRIFRSIFPPIDLFEDIADPADWPLIISAEQKTNPRLMETIGNLDLVPEKRRIAGPGASYLMAPFTHVSTDRPSRFSDGTFGVLHAGKTFEVAVFETIHHHGQFMARTNEPAGWTSQFREILLEINAHLHDLRSNEVDQSGLLLPDDYKPSQTLGFQLRASDSDGIVYPSVHYSGGECVGLFHPDSAANPIQGRHLDYHWNGTKVDLYRDATTGQVYRIV